MKAKVGEYYRHRWNKYVSKVTKVTRSNVTLKVVNSGVTEYIHTDNFDMNYTPCTTIYQWRDTIEDLFKSCEVWLMGDTIRVAKDTTIIYFCIDIKNRLSVSYTDDIKKLIDAESNMLKFLIEDADEVIPMFADLF